MRQLIVPRRAAAAGVAGIALLGLSLAPVSRSRQQDAPEGYRQIVPRGAIAAIDKPVYVTAGEASIRSEAWVLGVVVDGQPRAYSLNLLNHHEIVNDSIGGTNFAAVW